MSERLLRFWLNNTGHDPGQKTDALNSFLPLRPALNAFNSCNVEYYQKNNTIILIRYSDIYRILYIFLIFYTYLNCYFLPDIYINLTLRQKFNISYQNRLRQKKRNMFPSKIVYPYIVCRSFIKGKLTVCSKAII